MPPLEEIGTLPVSLVNTGLAASIGGIASMSAKLGVDFTDFTAAAKAGVEVALDFPPDPIEYGAAIGSFNVSDLIWALTPGNWTTLAADANIELGIKLGVVKAQLLALSAFSWLVDVGLGAGAIWGWSYYGAASQFGIDLQTRTKSGFGKVGPNESIESVILACENGSSWEQLSKSFSTGRGNSGLEYLGELNAAAWSKEVADLKAQLGRLKLELEGQQAFLEESIVFSTGLNLPDPQVIFKAGASILADFGIEGLLENLVTVRTDLTATLSGIAADVEATASLAAELTAQLTAGGIAVWKYSGPAAQMGTLFYESIKKGLPSGSGPDAAVHGLVLGGSGSAMSAFGTIFI